jgi:hypothetical protein
MVKILMHKIEPLQLYQPQNIYMKKKRGGIRLLALPDSFDLRRRKYTSVAESIINSEL